MSRATTRTSSRPRATSADRAWPAASPSSPRPALPALYGMPSTNFRDVTTGSDGYSAGAGYDLATGRGTPLADRVIPSLVTYGATVSTTSANPTKPPYRLTAASKPAAATRAAAS